MLVEAATLTRVDARGHDSIRRLQVAFIKALVDAVPPLQDYNVAVTQARLHLLGCFSRGPALSPCICTSTLRNCNATGLN